MKKLLFILFFIPIFCYTQSLQDLDRKNGFKEFQIGDSYSKWRNQLEVNPSLIESDGAKSYTYTGTCCQKIFEYSVEEIFLKFKNNRLVVISIMTEKIHKGGNQNDLTSWADGKAELDNLKSSFSFLFGSPSLFSMDQNSLNGDPVYQWIGNKVALEARYNYISVMEGDYLSVRIADYNYLRGRYQTGF